MGVHLIADTNLFFEFKTLEELPWQELGYDTVVVIILTKPVLDEIDKHKKPPGRTRARALEIFSRIRGMLTARTLEIEIRPRLRGSCCARGRARLRTKASWNIWITRSPTRD